MRCDLCENEALFLVHAPEEVRFVCSSHIEYFEFPFERIGDSPFVRSALDEAERIINALLSGKVVRFIHLRHPEVAWSVWDRERNCFVEKFVNSLDGNVFGPFELHDLQEYFENIGKAIASGWIAVVTNFQPEEILGGER
jgi:hypothetical protein